MWVLEWLQGHVAARQEVSARQEVAKHAPATTPVINRRCRQKGGIALAGFQGFATPGRRAKHMFY